jgi:hypothetical protein
MSEEAALIKYAQHLEAEVERLRAACDAAFYAMCNYRDNPVMIEEFQDAIDSLGLVLNGWPANGTAEG